MELKYEYESGAHCDHFLLAADGSDNSWRPKAGKFGSHQGSRLLLYVSAALSVAAAQFSAVEF